MITTSYFVWAELKSELFSNLYIKIHEYLKKNNIENIISFQNILSLHITFYYFENWINLKSQKNIKNFINNINLDFDIFIDSFKYFWSNKEKRIWYFYWKSEVDLLWIRNNFHNHFKMINVDDNNLEFIPHITFLRILDSTIYENYKIDIENIISWELTKIKEKNIFTHKIFLYKVNSSFPWQIQIKI